MAYHVELQLAAKTDTGLIRPHNEDSIAIGEEHGLVVLADGMGGYNAGEVASGMATAIIKETLEAQLGGVRWDVPSDSGKPIQQMMVNAVELANGSILQAASNDLNCAGMGTTVVAALFHHDKLLVAHVGDSRLYRLRDDQLMLMTRDHSLLQEQIDAGMIEPEQARFSPNRNLITRALGVDDGLDVEIHEHSTRSGDLYLLCSDGLSDMLSTKEIAEILRSDADPEAVCDVLIDRANENGGRDNSSVILVKVQSNKGEGTGLIGRMLNWVRPG